MKPAELRALLPEAPGRPVAAPAENLALEEALFSKNEGLTLRVWENAESVIIGRAQLAEFETDLDLCRSHGIPVVRRFTAGGAVYNGPGNVNWSLFVAREVEAGGVRYESSPRAVFMRSSKPVLRALALMGVDARLDPPNSIVTDRGKISGMAAYVSREGLLCHGTLLLGADLARVRALTTPSPDRLQRRYARSRDVKTANAPVDSDSFIRSLVDALADETGMTVARDSPSEEERAMALELVADKYGDPSWNLGDPFAWKKAEAALVR